MAILKCKMCGGDLVIEPEVTVCECEYCGTKQTVPNTDDEKKLKLYERANRLRFRSEFDKAAGVYESLVEEYPEEAEAYWGILLCKYGIEYVDDPATGDKVPTCHRSSFDSFMDDPDFDMVMENADAVAVSVYREQAKQIEELRKGIIEVSGKEEPYDIFICYKETDNDGERTLDSVLAQDVYSALTDKGYRVFFSRISLEDKLGTEYEPYIFAALNSVKIMLAFGTKYEYYNAVWVKNEWSRFLKLMDKDKEKHLIPCFKDIDVYDMPKEFAKLQAQDMGKVGAVQDLIRGIDKLMGKDTISLKSEVIHQVSGGPNVASLIDRGNMSLEDGAIEEARDYFNRALDIDSKSAEAYLGLFMADIKVKNRAAAKDVFISGDYTSDRTWSRIKQFAADTLSEELVSWEDERNARLHREEDEARRIKDEEDHKRQEYEGEREKVRAEIEQLEYQIREGIFEMNAEEQAESDRLQDIADKAYEVARQVEQSLVTCLEKQEVSRLESEIWTKEERIRSLGVFKGREKKELQSQIDVLRNNLISEKMKIEDRRSEVKTSKEEAELALKKATNYKVKIIDEKKNIIQGKIDELTNRDALLTMNIAEVGDTITFGHYEQGNGIAPIEWQLLDKKGSQVCIISKNVLDFKNFHFGMMPTTVTWENSDLRKWLNKDFLENAFSCQEKIMITETICDAPINPQAPSADYKSTVDKVFLLCIDEVEKYFASNSKRQCKATKYAKTQVVNRVVFEAEYSPWWLRSPGLNECCSTAIDVDGSIIYEVPVSISKAGIRPALWIELDIKDQKSASVYKDAVISEKKETETVIANPNVKTASNAIRNIGTAGIGDLIIFGRYEQGDGIKPIEWQVLDRIDDRILVISKHGLDAKSYHNKSMDITWDKSDLRNWLNRDFLSNAFSDEEAGMIEETQCEVPKNPQYSTPAGEATTDKIFLLSVNEADKYFSSNDERQCTPTEYAISKRVDRNKTTGNSRWWLRSPGRSGKTAAFVNTDEAYDYGCYIVTSNSFSVRPAMWIFM